MESSPVLAIMPLEQKSAARIFAGRYRVVRTLKQGKGIETLLATDIEQGEEVIIKIASDTFLSVGAQMRLEHEAGVVRQIRSPGFAPCCTLAARKTSSISSWVLCPASRLRNVCREGPCRCATR